MTKAKLKDQVKYVLSEYPETRNSDITLMIKVWELYFPSFIKQGATGEKGVWLKDLYDLPREDNVKRIRAIFQNDFNQFLPSDPEVRRKRGIEEANWLEFVRINTAHRP